VKGGTGERWSLKETSEFEEEGDSFGEIGLVTKDKFTGDQSPINL
jgi:hypothetical protein